MTVDRIRRHFHDQTDDALWLLVDRIAHAPWDRGQMQRARLALVELAEREGSSPPCGTSQGGYRHANRDESPCLPCRYASILKARALDQARKVDRERKRAEYVPSTRRAEGKRNREELARLWRQENGAS